MTTTSETLRIMIVDDNSVVHDGLIFFLNMFDDLEYVGSATNGQEAVQRCEALQPHVILMDINMPKMNGIEATQIITDKYPAISIIAMTSVYNDEDQQVAMLKAGAKTCLFKNTSTEEIVETIRNTQKTSN